MLVGMSNNSKRMAPLILLIGDVLVLLLFVFLGERDHNIAGDQPLARWLLTTFEFALPWVVAAWVLGAYPSGDAIMPRALLLRSMNAWLIALPLALLLRSLINGTGTIIALFMIVALTLGGAFMLIWRLVFALLWRRRTARATTQAT
jgi:hypothetical protein